MAASDKELITALRQTISRQEKTLNQQEKMLNQQNQTIQELRETVSNLRSMIANLEETLANWYNQCALEYLLPIYNRLHECLVLREVLHADEIPCQVLREPGKEASSKSYMWIYLTGNDGQPAIVLFDYRPGR